MTSATTERVRPSPDRVPCGRLYLVAGGGRAVPSIGDAGTGRPRTQPMVFVAAAGGGIRAAFWTEGVLDQVTRATNTCGRDSVFLVSSASGGSIGAALWSKDPAPATTEPARGARVLSDGTGLATLAAGLFFRDTAHALLGRDRAWDDRAALD